MPLVAVLLLGCATSQPSEYHQAARPMPVRGPLIQQQPPSYPGQTHAPTGTGLYRPETAGGQAVGRSPNLREVPSEPDGAPGLWAADGALRATLHGGSSDMRLFGVDLPLPVNASEAERLVTGLCTVTLTAAAKTRPGTEGYIDGLPEEVRRCLAARAFKHCAEKVHERIQRGLLQHPSLTAQDALEAFRHAMNVEKGYCSGVMVEWNARTALDWVIRRWNERLPVPKR